MKLSELIERLEAVKERHGDIDVVVNVAWKTWKGVDRKSGPISSISKRQKPNEIMITGVSKK